MATATTWSYGDFSNFVYCEVCYFCAENALNCKLIFLFGQPRALFVEKVTIFMPSSIDLAWIAGRIWLTQVNFDLQLQQQGHSYVVNQFQKDIGNSYGTVPREENM